MSGRYKGQGNVKEVYDVTSIGSGLTITRERKVDLTHAMAYKVLDEYEEFVGDRKLRQSHVDHLARTMLRGTFRPERVEIIVCQLGEKVYRMNGQHTAWARLEMPEDWKCRVRLVEYEAKSMQDMRDLYTSIDRNSPRTKTNVIESQLAGTDEFAGVKAKALAVAAQGFSMWFWKTKHERNQHDGDDIAYLLKTDHYDLAMKVCSFLSSLSSKENSHVFRGPVVGAMFATFHKAPQIALDFWGPVADGTGIEKKGDARLKLRTWLIQTAIGIGGGLRSDKQKVSQELMYRQCIGCWNAYRQGRPLQYLRATERQAYEREVGCRGAWADSLRIRPFF